MKKKSNKAWAVHRCKTCKQKRRALLYLAALEEIADGTCCGCCQPDEPQCDVGKAKDAIRTANAIEDTKDGAEDMPDGGRSEANDD